VKNLKRRERQRLEPWFTRREAKAGAFAYEAESAKAGAFAYEAESAKAGAFTYEAERQRLEPSLTTQEFNCRIT
jgi:hypothetical protein